MTSVARYCCGDASITTRGVIVVLSKVVVEYDGSTIAVALIYHQSLKLPSNTGGGAQDLLLISSSCLDETVDACMIQNFQGLLYHFREGPQARRK